MVCACVCVYSRISFTTIDFSQIVNCLEEWGSGLFQAMSFTGARYEVVHERMMELMLTVEKDKYHGRKLRQLLKSIATTGW